MRKISSAFITGATGTVGIGLVHCLIQNSVSVTVLCRNGSERRKYIPMHPLVHVLDGDLKELDKISPMLVGSVDAFFHLGWMGTTGAARNDMLLQNENIVCTLQAVQLAHRLGCTVFVGAGSQAEYGRVEGKLQPSTPTFPENGYGIAKLCAGQMSRVQCRMLGIDHIWMRILSVYGPGDTSGSMVMSSIRAMLRGDMPAYTRGEQHWDYLFSEDAGRALWLAARCGRNGATYPLGSGQAYPLREYILQIRDVVAPEKHIRFGGIPYAENQVMYLCADTTELTKDTGFIPRVGFPQGIAKTVQWVKEEWI